MTNPEIFISYARGGESEEIANALEQTFQEKKIKIVRDKNDLRYKGLIREFMQQIGEGNCVITVISDKYLKSKNCMFELLEIARNRDFYDRIFPIVLRDANIYDALDRLNYINYWDGKIEALNEAIKGTRVIANLKGITDEIDLYTNIRHQIGELTNILHNMNNLTSEMHREADFRDIIKAIEQMLNSEGNNMVKPKVLLVENKEPWITFLVDDIREALNLIGFADSECLTLVQNFTDASNALREKGPWNLLITDIALTSGDNDRQGQDLVEQASRLQVRTIVVSGTCQDEQVRNFLKVNKIYDFFSKGNYSVRKHEFCQEIQEILRETGKMIYQPKIDYDDFQVIVDANDKIRASSEQGDKKDDFRLEINDTKLALNLIKRRETDGDLLKSLGNKLFHALFPTAIRGHLRATMAGAEASERGVRLRLIFEEPELAALPWEFLYDADTNTFLANDIQTALSRYIDVPLQKRELKAASLPLKILLVVASPTDLVKLDAVGEEQLIRDALSKHINEGRIELDVLSEATIRNINQKLKENPYNVIHFIGHGVFENNKGFIALVDEDGKAKLLDDESFANFFLGNRSLGLAVLNSCQGAEVSSNQIFAGIAPHLVQRGIPAVVAMQYSILDSTAKLFADEFYRTLALGWPVDAAIQTTRNAISIEVGLDRRDFATPVLYMRAKDGVILTGL